MLKFQTLALTFLINSIAPYTGGQKLIKHIKIIFSKKLLFFQIREAMWNQKFQYFLNQHSNVYLEKDERKALRTRKHYIQIFFFIFMRYPCSKSSQLQRPTYRQYGFYLIKSSAPYMRRFTSTASARGARVPNRAISNSCLWY